MSEYHLFICEAAARAVNTFAYFECWVPNDKGTRLIYAGGQDLGLVEDDAAKQKINVFKKISERLAFEKGVSSAGRVWKLAAMEFQVDVSQLPVNTFLRNSFAQEAGLKAMLALPIVTKESGEPVAIGLFYRNQTMEFNSRLVDQMSFVVKQLCDNQSLIPHPTSGAALCLQAVNAETCAKLQDADAIESCRQILSLAPVARTSKDIRVLYDLMDGLSFFEQVSEKQRLDLCRCLTFRRVEQNQYVYQIGDSATEAYFLLTGKVKTSCKPQESADQPNTPVDTASSDTSGQSSDNRPNDILLDDSILSPSVARIFFGKKALTNDVNRDETAVAMETSELMVLSKQDYQRAITIPIKDLGFNELAQYFHLSMSEASKFLGVCVTVLKKVCRDRGIVRWPYRKIRSIDNAIEDLENSLSQDVGVTGSKAERIRQEIIELKLQRLQLTKDVKCLNFGVEVDVFGKTHRNVKVPNFTPSNYIKTTGGRKGRKQSKVESEEDSDMEDEKPSPPKSRKRKHRNASGNSSPSQSQSFSPKAHLSTEPSALNQQQMPSIPQAALSSGYSSQLGSSMNSFSGLGIPGLGNLGNGLPNGLPNGLGNGVANLETLMFLASQGINPQLLGMLSPAMGPQMQTPASPLLMNMLASAFMSHSLPHGPVSAPLSSNMFSSPHTPHGTAYHPSSYGYSELSRDPLAFLFANAQTAQASPQFPGASQFDRAFGASMPQPHRPQPRGGSPDSKRRRISEEMHSISGLMNQRSALESAHRLDVADMAPRR